MENKFNFSRRNPKTKKIENTGFMEFRNVSNNAADLGDAIAQKMECAHATPIRDNTRNVKPLEITDNT